MSLPVKKTSEYPAIIDLCMGEDTITAVLSDGVSSLFLLSCRRSLQCHHRYPLHQVPCPIA